MLNENIVSDIHGFSFIIFCCMVVFFFAKFTDVKKLQKEKQELENENKKLEYFLSEYFLHKMNDEELGQTFLTIIGNYVQGKELPKSFLYLVCGYSRCYDLMHSTILLEIDRFARLAQEKLGYTTSKGRDLLSKQSKLNDLLEELEEVNKKRNGGVRFINAPDILVEQARANYEQANSVGNNRRNPSPMGGIVEM